MRFTIYHRERPTFFDNSAEELAQFPTGWTLVATVETEEVGNVFQLTNHIDSNWTDNPQVIELFTPAHLTRSTSVGDVYTDERGGRYTVDGIGLRQF